MNLETVLTHFEEDDHINGAVVPPFFQNSLFVFDSWEDIDKAFDDRINNNIYSRGNNPTVQLVEKKLARIANAEKAKLFSSGMAAITAAILHFVKTGDHIIAVNNIYGPTNNFIKNYLGSKFKISVTYVQGERIEDFEEAIQDNTTLIYLESPSSAKFSLQDIEQVAQLAKSNGINTILDNTWATPVFQKALAMGIDLEVHSCTKYIGGHSDLLSGVIMGSKKDIDQIFTNEYELLGAKMAPYEAWLILRSLRTLSIRLERHQDNAMQVAKFLEAHPKVAKVNYPGLESFAQHELGKKQMQGYTGLMGFQLKTEQLNEVKTFFNSLKYFKIGVSWGGHESLIYAPAISYLKELSAEQIKNMGISLGDIRISVGLENVNDLMEDLEQALQRIK